MKLKRLEKAQIKCTCRRLEFCTYTRWLITAYNSSSRGFRCPLLASMGNPPPPTHTYVHTHRHKHIYLKGDPIAITVLVCFLLLS